VRDDRTPPSTRVRDWDTVPIWEVGWPERSGVIGCDDPGANGGGTVYGQQVRGITDARFVWE
jgi:hypothetical protein